MVSENGDTIQLSIKYLISNLNLQAPTSLIKDITKCKHPNSRKTLALAKKAKRYV